VALVLPRSAAATTRRLPRDVVVAVATCVTVAAAALALPGNADFPLVAVLVGLTAGTFVLSLDSAVWSLVPLLIVELSIKNYAFGDAAAGGGISLRLLVVIVAMLLSLGVLLQGGMALVRTTHGVQVVLPAVLFIVLATSFDLPREPADAVTKYLRYQSTQLGALVLVACMVRRSHDLRVVLGVGLALMVVSAALGVWQFFDTVHAPLVGAQVGAGEVLDPSLPPDQLLRTVGLTSGPIQLAGAAAVALPLLLGVFASGGVRSGRARWGLLLAAGVLGFATYLTFTRAAAMAIGAGLAAMAVFLPFERRVLIWASVAGAGLVFVLMQGSGVIGDRYYAGVSDDGSAAGHLALLEVGTSIALDNPVLGIGHAQFQDVSTGYAGTLSADARVTGGGAILGSEPPHNDFLLVWISWGLAGLAIYTAIFVGALANCVHVIRRTSDSLVRGAAIGTLGALVAYAVNSTFHNYLDTSLMLWLCGGLSIALVQILRRQARVAG
jgi:hypothetical protein